MADGWIKLYRKIWDCNLWQEKRKFSKAEAWIDLLLLMNHEDKKVLLGNEIIEVKRGSHVTSIRLLADRWKWSRTKTSEFLSLLESDKKILKNTDTKKTVLTVVNYDLYQGWEDTEKTQKRHKKDTKKTRSDTNNNEKNDNNENNNKRLYAEFVSMSEEKYQKLVSQHGEAAVKRMIEILNNYKGSSGKKYKSDYLAILSWVIDRYAKEGGKPIAETKPSKYAEIVNSFEPDPNINFNDPDIF